MAWVEVGAIGRSYIHHATWVPWGIEQGEQSDFLHAGPLRLVKAWCVAEWGEGGRWIKLDKDNWGYQQQED